ncbi:hypothetical protein LguiA_019289 [Lonicera macranthoides]
MTRNRRMTTSEIQKKPKNTFAKEKGKATPTELASLVRDSSPYTPITHQVKPKRSSKPKKWFRRPPYKEVIVIKPFTSLS